MAGAALYDWIPTAAFRTVIPDAVAPVFSSHKAVPEAPLLMMVESVRSALPPFTLTVAMSSEEAEAP